MKKFKKITVLAAAILTAVFTGTEFSADNSIVELFPETGSADITVRPDEERHKISPYIYGINDVGDISGFSPTVIKQTGTSLSTYNWENNCSNPGESGFNSNDISLVDSYSSASWNTPALYTDILYNKSRHANIPVKLVTLPMMGYVAKDSMGIVSDDVFSRTTRWCETKYRKNETFLISPDTTDGEVYIDEYVSFLVNKYGTSSEGGINGYFLDRQPDLWSKNFSVLGLPEITPSELVSRSAELASSVKAIDSTAFVFGPSVSDLQGCINLGSSDSWNSISENKEYSWFIDYYLSEMRAAGEKAGYRLLDCLDIHYYTKAMTPLGVSVVSSNDEYSNAYRMQSVKTLYDPDYTENSPVVLMNKQFTPVIPTLQASIRINYPGTRLSFSEYDFGGGDNISGAIAQTDALGIFAKENVYMACLSPISSDYRFQKAALSLYTDYDGKGHGFGDTLIDADNNKDSMSSVYAASDSSAPSVLRIILTNKNIVNSKDFDIEIVSEEYDYSLEKVYFIDKESAKVSESDVDIS
ncbi:MAG: glycoside hydrolase family 44 protein, partial [Huintestinicola sp.]